MSPPAAEGKHSVSSESRAGSSGPQLSVVVPSVNGLGDLVGCLQALMAEAESVALEILVADRVGEALRREVANRFPGVQLLSAPVDTTIPDLRALAFDAATAPVVAVIEDHVIVPPGWARAHLDAHARGEPVVGGAVENAATERLVDWAAFLCEYHHLIPPLPAGPVPGITGNNTSYDRTLLLTYRETWREGRWEDHLHNAMRRDGITLTSHPEIRVGHKKHYSVGEYLSQRYLYSRAWAGARASGTSAVARFVAGAARIALPPVLYLRIVRTIWQKGHHRRELVRSLPLLALFALGWALGEMVGFWRGPGTALAQVC